MRLRMSLTALVILLGCCIHIEAGSDYFWQLNDVHYDHTYWTTHDSCNVEKNREELGKYGDYDCDAPWDLIESAVKRMLQDGPAPRFIVWTGDIPGHPKNQSDLNQEIRLEMARNITELLVSQFGEIPILPVIGNHDFEPISQLPAEENEQYVDYQQLWDKYLPTQDAKETFRKGGYYIRRLYDEQNISAIVLNTNLNYQRNRLTANDPDPAGQFAWMRSQLNNLRTIKGKAHVIMHIPPGVAAGLSTDQLKNYTAFLYENHNKELNNILRDYGDVIIAAYAAHQHRDEFHILYKNDKPATIILKMPSLTPWRGRFGVTSAHNPAYRKVYYDNVNHYITNAYTYFMDLPEANKASSNVDIWKTEYTFQGDYGVGNITRESLDSLVQDFLLYANNRFHHYYYYSTVRTNDLANGPCGCVCKMRHICAIKNVDYDQYELCLDDPPVTCAASHASAMTTFISILVLFYSICN